MKHFVLTCFATIALTACALAQKEMTANRSEMVVQPTGLRTVVGCLSRTGETYETSPDTMGNCFGPGAPPVMTKAMNFHQPASDKSGGKGELTQNKTVNNARPVRLQSAVRPTVASLHNALDPSLNNVRHRGPNPAVVGGSANSASRNTGTINV